MVSMIYENINDYLNSEKNFDSELWVFDNEFSKNFITKSLAENIRIKSTSAESFFSHLEQDIKKDILSEIEVKLLTEKLILKNSELKFLENQNAMLSGFIELLRIIRLYPNYSSKNLNENIKQTLKTIYSLYRQECETNNFKDFASNLFRLSKEDIPKKNNLNKIVLIGEFFYLSELHWKVLFNYCRKYQNTVIISRLGYYINEFYQSDNYPEFNLSLRNYFKTNSENSLNFSLRNIDIKDIDCTVYADWEDEINHIAYKIKDDYENGKTDYSKVGVYIPDKLYYFKVAKIFDDYQIPHFATFLDNLSTHPLTKFVSFWFEMDWNKRKDVFKFLNSPFLKITYEELEVKTFNEKFQDIDLNNIEISEKQINKRYLEEIMMKAGIDNILFRDTVYQKINAYFQKEAKFSIDKVEKIAYNYKLTILYLDYFYKKIDELKNILPRSAYPNEFNQMLFSAFDCFDIKRNYLINNEPNDFYQKFLQFWQDITFYLSKIYRVRKNQGEKKHTLSDYAGYFKKFSQSIDYQNKEEQNGVIISDSTTINKADINKIYQVGLTSKLFPVQNSNDIFSKSINQILSHNEKDIQVFTLFEMLKKRESGNLEIYLSYPILINNEENEKSEILVDLGVNKPKKFTGLQEKITYSKTDKSIEELLNNEILNEQIKKIKEIHQHRSLNEWTKYEGHLESIEEDSGFLKNTSVTQVEEFAKCPMKFFFNRKLKIRAIKEKTEDIEANVKGIIVHKILENFYRKLITENTLRISIEEKQKIILEISIEVFKDFENIYDNLYLDYMKYQFNSGLKGEKKAGILQKILEADQEHILQGWIPAKTEYDFHYKIGEFNFGGSIDRIDEKDDQFQIIDYKSGGHDTTDDIKQGLAFQMPVYAMAYQDLTGKEFSKAFYYSMKNIEKIAPNYVMPEMKIDKRSNKIEVKTDNQTLMNLVTENLSQIKSGMKKSKFNFTLYDPDEACSYCDYLRACHYNPEKIVLLQNKSIQNNQYFNIIPAEKFVFPDRNDKSGPTGLTPEQTSALAIDKNIIVTAGAGAGKTEVLTNRMLNLLDNVQGEIGKILVITFTKKATAEMQLRIYSSIAKKIADNQDEHGYYLTAKQNFADNWISTIDGFYMRILKENSLDLKLENELSISEQKEINELIAQTIEKTIDNMAKDRDKSLEKILHIWSRKQIIEHCSTLLDKFWIYDYLEGKSLNDFANVYKQIIFNDIELHMQNIEGILESPDYAEGNGFPIESRQALLNWKYEFIRLKDNYENYRIPNLDEAFKLKRKPPKFDKDLNDTVKAQIETFNKTLEAFNFSKMEKEYLEDLIEVIKKVEKTYQEKRKKDNINTFSDISLLLYKMLKNNTNGIREKIKEKFRYIMIDEFQDTDQIQWEIAKYLSGWNGNDYSTMESDKLFLVGDDKQSIYGFRGGDVQVFNSAKTEVVEINKINNIDGGFIQFPDNFRSSANIIEFFNKFFAVLFDKSNKPYEASHQNLKGHKVDGTINFFLFYGKENNEDAEPVFIARQIKEILKKNPYEQIAILFRAKKNMPKFAKALENLRINYLITGGKGFYKNNEISDIYNILAYLSDETRNIELTGFLRSTMCCLSDTEIYHIKNDLTEGLKNHPEIYEKIYGKYEEEVLTKKGWKHLVCDLSIHELVIRIIDETFYKASLSNHKDSIQKIKNIEKFIEICKEHEDMNINEFVEFLEYQINNNEDEANATIIEMGDTQAVQLMTIHASKGLGFDTVILADSDSEGKIAGSGETISYGDIEGFKGKFIGFKVPSEDKFDKEHTVINNKILDYTRQKDEAELKRLLYVALTRVKHNLIVSATMKKTKKSFMGLFFNYFTEVPNIQNEAFISTKINDIDFHLFNCEFVEE